MAAYDDLFNKSEKKTLKKLAGQIARDIQPDITYRNIPFGYSQLDIHSDGEIVLLAVKTLSKSAKFIKVREFQVPASELRKFLLSSKVTDLFNTKNRGVPMRDKGLVKQVSQGVAELVHHSKEPQGTWVFSFYGDSFAFEKTGSSMDFSTSREIVDGKIILPGSSNSSFLVGGKLREETETRIRDIQNSLDFRIYHVLAYHMGWTAAAYKYGSINDNIIIKAA